MALIKIKIGNCLRLKEGREEKKVRVSKSDEGGVMECAGCFFSLKRPLRDLSDGQKTAGGGLGKTLEGMRQFVEKKGGERRSANRRFN